MDFKGYCFRCRDMKTIHGGSVTTAANGRPLASGPCPTCGTQVNRFLSDKEFRKLAGLA